MISSQGSRLVVALFLAVGGVGILGVDFAANASSKAIKESVDLSAAPNDTDATYSTSINTDNQYVYTFNYNGTYPLNKVDITGPRIGYYTQGNTLGMDGSVQTIKLAAGKYKLEVWGAQGGEGYFTNTYGGRGGYSYGTITLTAETTLYIAVGGKGSDTYRNEKSGGPVNGGGWNGGGHLVSTGGATGGGATHIATAKRGDGQLKNYNSYRAEVLLVGGGGGGGAHDTENFLGGGGGGKSGGQSGSRGGYVGSQYAAYCHGLGATTSAGGGHASNDSTHRDVGSWTLPCTNGSFGQGGDGTGHHWGGGGGGGGWFGGGGGNINGGGGGSGYVNTTKLTDYGGSATDAAVREGHGLAKITDLTKCATQSSVPTVSLNRHETKTFAFAGTSATNSLLGVDPNNLALSVHTNAVYQVNIADTATQETLRARTWADTEKADAAANKWLSYSFTSDGITLKATRYWTGTKAFYVRIKNAHGLPSWFKFYATVEGGELKKDQTLR